MVGHIQADAHYIFVTQHVVVVFENACHDAGQYFDARSSVVKGNDGNYPISSFGDCAVFLLHFGRFVRNGYLPPELLIDILHHLSENGAVCRIFETV